MFDMVTDLIINLHDDKQIKVVYDYEKDCFHIIKPNTIITINDMKNALYYTIEHLSNDAYNMKNIDYVNSDALGGYYNEIIDNMDLCDMDLLKDLFDKYMK